jgi:purine-nucleoside phosphorylase
MKLNNSIIEKYSVAVDILKIKFKVIPDIAVIAGSGIASTLNQDYILCRIKYEDLLVLPKTSVFGHNGEVLLYEVDGYKAIIFTGRFHYYEGRTYEEINSLIFLSHLIGISKIVITNAAGGLNPLFKAGDLMIIEDIIDFMFPKNSNIFDYNNFSNKAVNSSLSDNLFNHSVKKSLLVNKITYHTGNYASVSGANYETRAEIRMLRLLGADAVGMSTVPEIKTALSLGMNIIACSLITNVAKEIIQSVSHDEVIEIAQQSTNKIRDFIENVIKV